jgi:hypothetical protein
MPVGSNRLNKAIALAAALTFASLGGCSDKRAVKTVPVQGVVRLESGPWPATGNISFVPVEAAPGYPLRPGWAEFNQQGEFSAGCFEDGDGLVPGKYAVNIDCWDTVIQVANGKPTKPKASCIPARYQRGFKELVVSAEADDPIEVEWVIPSK